MAKKWTKKKKNLTSLISGIILILIGMGGGSISLISMGLKGWIIPPLIIFIIGIILAYFGATERW